MFRLYHSYIGYSIDRQGENKIAAAGVPGEFAIEIHWVIIAIINRQSNIANYDACETLAYMLGLGFNGKNKKRRGYIPDYRQALACFAIFWFMVMGLRLLNTYNDFY